MVQTYTGIGGFRLYIKFYDGAYKIMLINFKEADKVSFTMLIMFLLIEGMHPSLQMHATQVINFRSTGKVVVAGVLISFKVIIKINWQML